MILSRYTLKNINPEQAEIPAEGMFELPEKVLQFGTGVLLRGLPDYYIDKANRRGIFNGRVVVVKSTGAGDTEAFDKQDSLYTICIRGIENGDAVAKNIISSAISRVIAASSDWKAVLECAHNPELKVIISNTTEVGISLVKDDVRQHPPLSFPGKLLAFLFERYNAFGGSPTSGMVIVPTELIPDNGRKLEAIILELAHLNDMDTAFIDWLEKNNRFCNSLVDRIVPGKPSGETLDALQDGLGYRDDLLTVSESYSLWAIEGDDHIRSVLAFADADPGVIITPDIGLYRELKLRLLNATHTLSCGLAVLAGFETVKAAADDERMSGFIGQLMMKNIAPAIPYEVPSGKAEEFAGTVIDRFRNPHIDHKWLSISQQYSAKMKMRVLPLLKQYYKLYHAVPECIAAGFAGFLKFMQGSGPGSYSVTDDQAAYFSRKASSLSGRDFVRTILSDKGFWETDLAALPGFAEAVTEKFLTLEEQGAAPVLAGSGFEAQV